MNYYLDTEFAESRGSIKLISLGIVDEFGNTFYAENSCFDINDANDWVKENVIPKLRWHENVESTRGHNNVSTTGDDKKVWEVYGSPQVIRDALLEYLQIKTNTDPDKTQIDFKRNFYAYYAAYDWVVFCWIFGCMVDLPAGMPMFCHDLKPMLDQARIKKPEDPTEEHNALADAFWNRELHFRIEASKL